MICDAILWIVIGANFLRSFSCPFVLNVIPQPSALSSFNWYNFPIKSCIAISRFCGGSVLVNTSPSPVGLWINRTAVLTLFTFWFQHLLIWKNCHSSSWSGIWFLWCWNNLWDNEYYGCRRMQSSASFCWWNSWMRCTLSCSKDEKFLRLLILMMLWSSSVKCKAFALCEFYVWITNPPSRFCFISTNSWIDFYNRRYCY